MKPKTSPDALTVVPGREVTYHNPPPIDAQRASGTKRVSVEPLPEFRPIESIETTLHDPVRERWEDGSDEGGVRLYCTASALTHGQENARWALQVRAKVKTRTRGPGKQFAVGTASMSRKDLLWLRDLIDGALRKKR